MLPTTSSFYYHGLHRCLARFGSIFSADWQSSRVATTTAPAYFDESWPTPSEPVEDLEPQGRGPVDLENITGVAPWSRGFQAPSLSMRSYFNNFPLSPRAAKTPKSQAIRQANANHSSDWLPRVDIGSPSLQLDSSQEKFTSLLEPE